MQPEQGQQQGWEPIAADYAVGEPVPLECCEVHCGEIHCGVAIAQEQWAVGDKRAAVQPDGAR
jgi:hypothetical protein